MDILVYHGFKMNETSTTCMFLLKKPSLVTVTVGSNSAVLWPLSQHFKHSYICRKYCYYCLFTNLNI